MVLADLVAHFSVKTGWALRDHLCVEDALAQDALTMRFAVGDRVACKVSEVEWSEGTVVTGSARGSTGLKPPKPHGARALKPKF